MFLKAWVIMAMISKGNDLLNSEQMYSWAQLQKLHSWANSYIQHMYLKAHLHGSNLRALECQYLEKRGPNIQNYVSNGNDNITSFAFIACGRCTSAMRYNIIMHDRAARTAYTNVRSIEQQLASYDGKLGRFERRRWKEEEDYQ